MPCALCGSPSVDMRTCPLNDVALHPNMRTHPFADAVNMSTQNNFCDTPKFKMLLEMNRLRTDRFVQHTQSSQGGEQSIDKQFLQQIRQINALGFFTVDSGDGLCGDTIITKEGKSVDSVKHPYIIGFLPKCLLKKVKKELATSNIKLIIHTEGLMPASKPIILEYETVNGSNEKVSIFAIRQRERKGYFEYNIESITQIDGGYGDGVLGLVAISSRDFYLVTIYGNTPCITVLESKGFFDTIVHTLGGPITLPSVQYKTLKEGLISLLEGPRLRDNSILDIYIDLVERIIELASTSQTDDIYKIICKDEMMLHMVTYSATTRVYRNLPRIRSDWFTAGLEYLILNVMSHSYAHARDRVHNRLKITNDDVEYAISNTLDTDILYAK